jgi:hypothetical protein
VHLFERYNIVNQQDLREAARKMGTISGTIGHAGTVAGEKG